MASQRSPWVLRDFCPLRHFFFLILNSIIRQTLTTLTRIVSTKCASHVAFSGHFVHQQGWNQHEKTKYIYLYIYTLTFQSIVHGLTKPTAGSTSLHWMPHCLTRFPLASPLTKAGEQARTGCEELSWVLSRTLLDTCPSSFLGSEVCWPVSLRGLLLALFW
jgi:hypothetical protein